ncbi:hypothetical protein QR680_011538 [Steinernema hermaphroditum]|uniref:Uncharacterized protein n=1 Tax=Steinernema hermaphroditum TaxID=289476 RepID=A0AA39LY87_9BILA|nr:hypothetical protein QR680_011538 [Steinernema hermaphroditum]
MSPIRARCVLQKEADLLWEDIQFIQKQLRTKRSNTVPVEKPPEGNEIPPHANTVSEESLFPVNPCCPPGPPGDPGLDGIDSEEGLPGDDIDADE